MTLEEQIELAKAIYAILQVIMWLQIVQVMFTIGRAFGNFLSAILKGL